MHIRLLNLQGITFKNNHPQSLLFLEANQKVFILVLSQQLQTHQKIIFFQYLSQTYTAVFMRYISQYYASKLLDVLSKIVPTFKESQIKEWFSIFEVRRVETSSFMDYQVEDGVYGGEVAIRFKGKGIISNIFKNKDLLFYLVSSKIQKERLRFYPITLLQTNALIGFHFIYHGIQICLPFRIIFSDLPCTLKINPTILPILNHTCYLYYDNSYCSGIRISPSAIITTKHLIPEPEQKIGLKILIRLFPYHAEIHGYVSKICQKADLMEINISQLYQNKTILPQWSQSKGQKIGKSIFSIGFGKYSFLHHNFFKLELVLPTIELGIISKVIRLDKQEVFIKTDAALYNGCSGSGLWSQDGLQAMAIFILKNKDSLVDYNRHNFSYSFEIIKKMLEDKIQGNSPIFSQMRQFEKIYMREFIKRSLITSKL